MNPFHKLHLPNAKRDIYRSCVGIFVRVDMATRKVTAATFDFMHGRWPKVATEPKSRIESVMKHRNAGDVSNTKYDNGAFVHLVYLSSAARWWTNALNSINEQLIEYESKLQSELDNGQTTPETVMTKLNRELHSIAAHLHRYLSELRSLREIVVDLLVHYKSIHAPEIERGNLEDFEQASSGFRQVLSQIEASQDFATELEKKTQNILALVSVTKHSFSENLKSLTISQLFNRIQISSDRLLVTNGQAMQAILTAMQADANLGRKMAKATHALSIEMKRDSIAMRTVSL